MADDSLISQSDIDNLLASLSMDDMEAAADTAGKQASAFATTALSLDDWLNQWVATAPLANGLSLSVQAIDCIERWDNWTYSEAPATLLVEQYGSQEVHQTLLMLPSAELQRLAVHTLGDDPTTASMPVTEPQMTSLGGALKTFVKQLNDTLTCQYGAVDGKLTPFEITDYDADFLADIAPWLKDGDFYEVAWTLKGLTTGDITVYQLWQKAEADRLLNLAASSPANKPEPEPVKPHATAPTVTTTQASSTVAEPITVQPVQFSSFDNHTPLTGEANKNLDLVLDITLNLSVELGKTQLSIKEVLELTRGSVIELDRIAGEPVDLYANGKLIAKGEVVVIEDNFGLRITSIASPADRLKGLA
jgi:flagellar motor switch protein FliN